MRESYRPTGDIMPRPALIARPSLMGSAPFSRDGRVKPKKRDQDTSVYKSPNPVRQRRGLADVICPHTDPPPATPRNATEPSNNLKSGTYMKAVPATTASMRT